VTPKAPIFPPVLACSILKMQKFLLKINVLQWVLQKLTPKALAVWLCSFYFCSPIYKPGDVRDGDIIHFKNRI
jgi:hypothetical protein